MLSSTTEDNHAEAAEGPSATQNKENLSPKLLI